MTLECISRAGHTSTMQPSRKRLCSVNNLYELWRKCPGTGRSERTHREEVNSFAPIYRLSSYWNMLVRSSPRIFVVPGPEKWG